MPEFDPFSDAEWMLETIIDDFAESLTPAKRTLFYSRLAQLLARRRHQEAHPEDATDSEPKLPPQVQ